MKKQLIKCMFTALMFGMLASFNAMAAEPAADSSIRIGELNNISLTSENAGQDGITAIQLSLKVEPSEKAEISFDFNPENSVKVSEFRYHEESNLLNIYIADTEPIFNGSDWLDLGTVSAIGTDGNSVEVKITVVEDSLKFVSQNTLTDKTFSVEDEKVSETTTADSASSAETTTTTATDGESKSLEVERMFPTSYLITIPDGTESLEERQDFNVSAENILLEYGKTLELSVTSDNGWKLRDKNNPENKSVIVYSIGYGSDETCIKSSTQTILSVGKGKESGNVKLTVLSIDDAKMAGTFADTLTFSVNIAE